MIKKIYLPHLHYTIYIRDINKAKEMKDYLKRNPNAKMCAEDVDSNEGILYLKYPIKNVSSGSVGHEIIHILQFIAKHRGIDFTQELEHFGYLFQFIFNEIYEREYA